MASTLQRIFQQHFHAFAVAHRLPPHWYRAANQFIRCRTAALGGHVQACPAGHVERVWYNSCKHRTCPQCNRMQMDQWLYKQRARLLDGCHHHLIFTIPHAFNPLWMANTPAMMEILFRCTRECLDELLSDARRLGAAQPGYLLALHTWGRSLSLHPHLHCLITDGGLSDDGWQRPKGSCFLPARVLMAKFRGKFIALLRAALDAGQLRVPPDAFAQPLQACLNQLGRTKWNVRIQERYGHGNGVVQYLARYVRGGPLHDGQVSQVGADRIAFRYTPHGDGDTACRSSVLTLTPAAFFWRYLQHVQQPRKQTVRSYGLYAPRRIAQLNRARAVFKQAPVVPFTPLLWQAYYAQTAAATGAHCCPVCGAAIGLVREVAPQHDPPAWRTLRGGVYA